MPIEIKIVGRVIPGMTAGPYAGTRWSTGIKYPLGVNIRDGVFEATTEVPNGSTDELSHAIHSAKEGGSLIVNLNGFRHHVGPVLTVEKIRQPTGEFTDLGATVPNQHLFPSTSVEKDSEWTEVFTLLMSDSQGRLALHDLITSLHSIGQLVLVSAARVLDGIKHGITPDDSVKDKQKWKNLHAALRGTEAYFQFVTELSKAPRHAKQHVISDADYYESIRRAWTSLDRYFHYLRRGKQPLPESDFPMLGEG